MKGRLIGACSAIAAGEEKRIAVDAKKSAVRFMFIPVSRFLLPETRQMFVIATLFPFVATVCPVRSRLAMDEGLQGQPVSQVKTLFIPRSCLKRGRGGIRDVFEPHASRTVLENQDSG
jgi:hypothetical protein